LDPGLIFARETPMVKTLMRTDAGQWATLPLRIALGVIFLAHGGQKLFGWFGGKGLLATAGYFEGKWGVSPGLLWACWLEWESSEARCLCCPVCSPVWAPYLSP
jgi:uncharacterized membrane protein YphA (DoxX/SURF4 family)